jgi:glucose-1-phosphate adenylyltransferase
MAFILAGGRGSRLKELTDDCAKPAVPFGGGARIIDFALSNALNSGIRRIGVATQYKQDSLIRHVAPLSNLLYAQRGGSLDILPGDEPGGAKHYGGTADAVFRNIAAIERRAPRYVLILAGDHIYKMDYEHMIRQHVEAGADVTVGCLTVPSRDARGFGVMDVDGHDRITAFVEKPRNPPGIPGTPGFSLASMGIYVFDTAFLLDELRRDAGDSSSTHDFGADIMPHIVRHGVAFAHRFSTSCVGGPGEARDYWRDVGTLDAYFDANLDVLPATLRFDMQDGDWPMWTDWPNMAKTACGAEIASALMTADSFVHGSRIKRSLLFKGAGIGAQSSLEESLILPNCSIGRGARLSRVIVGPGVDVPDGLVVGEDPDLDAMYFRRTEGGVCLITRAMIERLPDRQAMRSAA